MATATQELYNEQLRILMEKCLQAHKEWLSIRKIFQHLHGIDDLTEDQKKILQEERERLQQITNIAELETIYSKKLTAITVDLSYIQRKDSSTTKIEDKIFPKVMAKLSATTRQDLAIIPAYRERIAPYFVSSEPATTESTAPLATAAVTTTTEPAATTSSAPAPDSASPINLGELPAIPATAPVAASSKPIVTTAPVAASPKPTATAAPASPKPVTTTTEPAATTSSAPAPDSASPINLGELPAIPATAPVAARSKPTVTTAPVAASSKPTVTTAPASPKPATTAIPLEIIAKKCSLARKACVLILNLLGYKLNLKEILTKEELYLRNFKAEELKKVYNNVLQNLITNLKLVIQKDLSIPNIENKLLTKAIETISDEIMRDLETREDYCKMITAATTKPAATKSPAPAAATEPVAASPEPTAAASSETTAIAATKSPASPAPATAEPVATSSTPATTAEPAPQEALQTITVNSELYQEFQLFLQWRRSRGTQSAATAVTQGTASASASLIDLGDLPATPATAPAATVTPTSP